MGLLSLQLEMICNYSVCRNDFTRACDHMNECYGGNETRVSVQLYDMLIRHAFCAKQMPRTVDEYDIRQSCAVILDQNLKAPTDLHRFLNGLFVCFA